MKKMIQTEWWKLRRCQILLVGIVALALCPVVQYGSQLIVNPEIRDPNFDFVHLFANVVWGNTQVFLPISLVMIGGWLIDRENTHDTMKNLLTVPVSYLKLLGGKLAVTGLLSLLFGLYSVAVTVLTGTLAGLPGLTPGVILQQGGQVVAAALTTFLVCMPMILIFGQMRGAYLGGSILTFFLGYCILFFKSGFLLSAYPFSAALVLAGFDMQEYNGATEAPSIPLALLGMTAVIVLTAVILAFSRPSSKAGSTKKKEENTMKENRKRWTPLLTCGLFCVLLLSGCSGMMQSLADGTDAVLNGLAEGTDQVAGALADMTDAALGAAADATDDSVKDAILDAYSSLMDTAGSWALTPDRSLQGERVRGEDDYTGTYAADYMRTSPVRNCSLAVPRWTGRPGIR